MLRDFGHAGAFGDVLANQAVGVFAGAALPRMMRSREEEEADAGSTLELNVVVELGAVVSGDGFESLRGVFLRFCGHPELTFRSVE